MRAVTERVTVPPQLVRECKEVLKGGLLMKQYYQFMLLGLPHGPGASGCNMDAFEEDLHKMLMVRAAGASASCASWRLLVRRLIVGSIAEWPPNRIRVRFCFIEPHGIGRICKTWEVLGTLYSSGSGVADTRGLSLVWAGQS